MFYGPQPHCRGPVSPSSVVLFATTADRVCRFLAPKFRGCPWAWFFSSGTSWPSSAAFQQVRHDECVAESVSVQLMEYVHERREKEKERETPSSLSLQRLWFHPFSAVSPDLMPLCICAISVVWKWQSCTTLKWICHLAFIMPYIIHSFIHFPQCIVKSRVQPTVTIQALCTIVHCAGENKWPEWDPKVFFTFYWWAHFIIL